MSKTGGGSTTQCWECQRRRLVCDRSIPVCNKCRTTGIVCPGYGDKKPLVWLTPGKVKSRTRKRKSPSPVSKVEKPSEALISKTKASSDNERQASWLSPQPDLRPEICDIVEAARYYNEHIYSKLVATQLEPTPYIVPIDESLYLPIPAVHIMVSMAIRHRVIQLPQTTDQDLRNVLWSRSLRYHDLALRGLNEAISQEASRTSVLTISTVALFLVAELQQSASTNWRYHLDGLTALVSLRGGWPALLRDVPSLKLQLLSCIMCEVVGDTTSPALEKIASTVLEETSAELSELYNIGYFLSFPCPFQLFMNIMQINQLRSQATTSDIDHYSPRDAAYELLNCIRLFSPEEWSESKEGFRDEWLLIGRIFQAAVAIYAIASLQSLSVLPTLSDLVATKNEAASRLFELLQQAAQSPQVKNSIVWPLVVLGVVEVNNDADIRDFVSTQLSRISHDVGTALPLTARSLLETFWSSGKTIWDECFDRPYAFLI